jgi:hypothetical protein
MADGEFKFNERCTINAGKDSWRSMVGPDQPWLQ